MAAARHCQPPFNPLLVPLSQVVAEVAQDEKIREALRLEEE